MFVSVIEAMADARGTSPPGTPSACEQVLISLIAKAKHKLIAMIAEVTGISDEPVLAYKTIQLMSSLLHPMLISTIPSSLFGLDFTEPLVRQRYLDTVIASLQADGEFRND